MGVEVARLKGEKDHQGESEYSLREEEVRQGQTELAD